MKSVVNCYDLDGETVVKQLELPNVLCVPIRRDIVQEAFKCMRMNSRLPYAVSPNAGMQHSAHSWGTGRAIARVPRVSGSGTGRSGQGAFANFCRKGRLAHPTNVLRRWNRKFNLRARRHAVAMALAASTIAPLVESRGHKVSNLKMLPLVVSNRICEIKKTRDAISVLKVLGLGDELKRVKDSKTIRAGKGKMRNRRYVVKRGILIIYERECNMTLSFRNIEGVDLMSVNSLNLLELCPGGHLGRLILWTLDAFEKLDVIYGKGDAESPFKKGYFLPTRIVSNDDIESVFYSDEVQAFLDAHRVMGAEKSSRNPREIERINPYLCMEAEDS